MININLPSFSLMIIIHITIRCYDDSYAQTLKLQNRVLEDIIDHTSVAKFMDVRSHFSFD